MKIINLFSTNLLIIDDCKLNLSDIEDKCFDHLKNVPSSKKSNQGGYQGANFYHKDLFDFIEKIVVQNPKKPILEYDIYSWLNINKQGDYNEIHSHNPHEGNFLSGVFYVRCPINSGRIRFYDPRPNIGSSPEMMYYCDGARYQWIEPKSNMLLLFPSWLEHDVEINKSKKERVSIAFNIYNLKY